MRSMYGLALFVDPRMLARLTVASVLRLASCGLIFGQLVEIGPQQPAACDEVKVQPNLTLSRPSLVDGHVADPSGAAIANARLELRLYKSELEQTLLKRTQTDAHGDFSLGATPAGRYRLLFFIAGFKQADQLKCPNGDACHLSIVLQLSPTDTFPESVCQPR